MSHEEETAGNEFLIKLIDQLLLSLVIELDHYITTENNMKLLAESAELAHEVELGKNNLFCQ
jgi:hypothetical protein